MAQLEQIFSLEYNLEKNFQSVLSSVTTKCYISRDRRTSTGNTPWISSKITMQGITGAQGASHDYVQPDGNKWVSNAWRAELETTVATNRPDEESQSIPDYYLILAKIRKLLTPIYQLASFGRAPISLTGWDSSLVLLTDIREVSSENTLDNENSIDYTFVKWFVLVSIPPTAWPSNLT